MKININDAIPGMMLEEPIVRNQVVLVGKNEPLTPAIIKKLKDRFAIESIDIVSGEKSNEEENMEDTISEKLFLQTKEALLKHDIEKIEENATHMVSAVLKSIDFNGSFSNLKYNLEHCNTLNKTAIENSLDHSIRVATFSIILTYLYNDHIKRMVKDKQELERRLINYKDITLAALLHDSGKFQRDQALLERVQSLLNTPRLINSLQELSSIPKDRFDDRYTEFYSFCLSHEFEGLSDNTRIMILLSNENENNTGPLKVKGFNQENLPGKMVGAKIIHLCSLYDDYLSHCINTKESLENVVAILGQAANRGVINSQLTNIFLNNVPIYPLGTEVKLSNGEKGTVVKTFTGYNFATRPVVRLTTNRKIVRLKEETSIVISGICYNNDLVDSLVNDQLQEIDHKLHNMGKIK